ncbi:hypothetical protein AAC387_Pa07g1050 [Persea americana]
MNLGRLGSLRLLNLEENLLGSVEAEDMSPLSSLANCSSLEILSLSINRLRGVLPSSIANFSTNLQQLYLAKNQIFGSIPSGIGNLVNLILVTVAFNFMTGDDFKALVFNYMANGNLERWLHPSMDEQHQPKYLSLIQRLNIAVDVASALNYLHNSCKKPIVHCDLKPSNILLDDDMNAHVGDFGLARFLSEVTSNCSQNQTSSTGIKGTIGYIPPEYGMGGGVSTFGDIYSYGILLLEMFTGKKPTDEIFNENLSLHQFAKLALTERVIEIVDQKLLSAEAEALNESQTPTNAETKLEMCLISTFKVGVACCVVSITD